MELDLHNFLHNNGDRGVDWDAIEIPKTSGFDQLHSFEIQGTIIYMAALLDVVYRNLHVLHKRHTHDSSASVH